MLCGLFQKYSRLPVSSSALSSIAVLIACAKEPWLRTQMPLFSHSGPAARNGIFECRDGAPKFVAECANADRDKNLRIEWPEIPAETAYLASRWNLRVWEDWMVVCAVRYEPVSARDSLLTGKITGYFCKFEGSRRGFESKSPSPQPLLTKFPA